MRNCLVEKHCLVVFKRDKVAIYHLSLILENESISTVKLEVFTV